MEQRATSHGAPPRVPSPGLARCQGPRGPRGYKLPGAQGASGKRSLAPTTPLLGPQKRSGGVKHPPHDGGGATAQAGSHQKNRREQKFASCSGLGFRILPVEAAAGRDRAALVMELLLEAPAGRLRLRHSAVLSWGDRTTCFKEWSTGGPPAPLPLGSGIGSGGGSRTKGRPGGLCPGPRSCEARLQARLMEPLRETAAPKAPDRGAYVWAPGCKFYEMARSEPGPPPRRRRGRGRLHQKRSLSCGEDQEKAGTRR